MTESELEKESALLGESIYWVGPRDGYRYELSRTEGRIFVRYLPDGVDAGASGSGFLTVATYPLPGAYGELCVMHKYRKESALAGSGSGLYIRFAGQQRSVYVAFPGVDYEIEVYDPDRADANAIASSGQVRPVTG